MSKTDDIFNLDGTDIGRYAWLIELGEHLEQSPLLDRVCIIEFWKNRESIQWLAPNELRALFMLEAWSCRYILGNPLILIVLPREWSRRSEPSATKRRSNPSSQLHDQYSYF